MTKRGVDVREWVEGGSPAAYEELLRLGMAYLRTPVGLVTIVDEPGDRQVFRGALGLREPWASLRQTPLSHSFCRLVAETSRPLVVTDARADARVQDNPAVEELAVIAYLGVPIHDPEGRALGSLCVIDSEPRTWTAADVDYLHALGQAVDRELRLERAQRLSEEERRELRASRAELDESTSRFRDLASNVPGAIFRYVESSDGSSRVDYMSPGCLEIWEIPAEEVADDASKLWAMILPEDLPDMQASVRRSAEHFARWQHRWRIRTPSGKLKWLEGYGLPMPGPSNTITWNSLILDVTVEVRAQQQLAENTRVLLEASKQEAIGRLAGGIAHDFNNLLSIVLANAERILEGPDEQAETTVLVEEIRDAALRGAELTQRILSFARRSDLRFAAVDVNRVVSSMHNLIHRTLPGNVTLETALMAGLWKTWTDPTFLESALLNLVVNARDAMPRGGKLTIETANVRVTDEYVEERHEDVAPGRYVMIAVTDTGEGIESAHLARIFDPFFTTKPTDKGTGLGLAMVHGFSKQSGGTVRVYSEVGRGTCFRVYLPVAEESEDAPLSESPRAAPHVGHATLLLVEDQAAVRRALKGALESAGFTVVEADSGDAALAVYESGAHPIELVVTDVVMPGHLQGPELIAAIRAKGHPIPVVYVSGYPHEANVHGNGIAAHDVSLIKPVDRETLRLAVARALARARG